MTGDDRSVPDQTLAPAVRALVGGGEMGDRIRAHDWAATPFGPPAEWPSWLLVAVGLCIDMAIPTTVYGGDDFLLFYNDGFAPLLAERHPWALGRPAAEVWPEIWPVLGAQFATVVATGRGLSWTDQRFDLVRGGRLTEAYFQYSFNPLHDETGRVTAIFNTVIETTERVLLERRQVAEIEQLRSMFEQTPSAIAVLRGPDHVFEVVNRSYRRATGDRPILGRAVREAVPDFEAQGFLALLDQVYTTGQSHEGRRAPFQLPQTTNQPGVTLYYDYIYQPITDATGAVTGIFIEANDTTDQVHAEEQLRANEARQAFRAQLTDALNNLADPVAVMARASELLGRFLNASRVFYAEIDEARGTALLEREWNDGSMPSIVGAMNLDDFGPVIQELKKGVAVVVADVTTDPRTGSPAELAVYQQIGLAAFLSTPLVKDGQLVAVLGVNTAVPRTWSAADRTLAVEVAERTWAAVEQARAEAALRQSELLHRLVVEQASEGIWLADTAGRFLDVNAAGAALLGYTREEHLALSILDVIDPNDALRLTDLLVRLKDGTQAREEWNLRRHDGSFVPVELSMSCLPDGRPLAVGRDVTQRRQAEARDRQAAAEAIRAAETNAKFRTFFDQGWYFAAILGLDGTVHEVNRIVVDQTGFARDAIVGKKFWDSPTWTPRPAIAERIRQGVSRAASGLPFHEALPHFMADGSERLVDTHLMPAFDDAGQVRFVVASGTDITDRQRAEADLRSSEARFAAALVIANLGTFEWNVATNAVTLDDRSREIMGFAPGEGTQASEVFGRIDPAEFDRVWQLVQDSHRLRTRLEVEYRIILPDGTVRIVASSSDSLTSDDGQSTRLVGVFRDITERKQAEEALRRLAADLSEADHRKDEFLAMLAHELRNPLGAISGAVQLAGATDQAAQLDEFRDLIGRQVVHLTRLIDDLLDVSRITQGKITLQPATVELATIVRRAVELVQPIITQKRHTLTVTLPDDVVRFVADPTRTEQILGNLLTNAAKYTEPGGRIDLEAHVEGVEVVFQVRDTGIGIAAAMLPEVFGLFTQVDATIDRAQGGLGIGLTLVRNLVEMHGGRVFAASAGKGHGSEFTVRLPIGQPALDSSRSSGAVPLRKATATSRPRTGRVLVVDDNLDTARLTARMLRLAGYEVATAHDGLAAVELALRLHPTVVLLDIGLPGMNGYEVAAALREHESCRDATIIAISGYGEEKARERSGTAGFNHHLTKPVDFNRLLSLIDA